MGVHNNEYRPNRENISMNRLQPVTELIVLYVHVCIYIYIVFQGNKVPISFTNLNDFTTPQRFTRQSQHQYANQKRARTKLSSLLHFHQMPKIWNELHVDDDLKEIPTLICLKRELTPTS